MKMAVCFSRRNKLVLALMGLMILCACGGETDKDLKAPKLTLDVQPSTTFSRTRTLTGTIEEGADLEVLVSTDATVGEISNQRGLWSVAIGNLPVGSTLVTVTADDSQGNSSSLQFYLTYSLLLIDQADSVTALDTSTLYGRLAKATEGADITKVTLNGSEQALPTTSDDGSFSFEVTGLANGSNTVAITATDSAGRTQTKTQTIVLDTGAVSPFTLFKPDVPIPGGANSLDIGGTVDANATVTISFSDPDKTAQPATNNLDGTWTATVDGLAERETLLKITAFQEGRTSASASTRLVVDSLPALEETVPDDGGTAASDTTVRATFSEAVVFSTISFLLEDASGKSVAGETSYDAAQKTVVFTPAAPLKPGGYTATVTGVKDPDGNNIDTPIVWSFTVN